MKTRLATDIDLLYFLYNLNSLSLIILLINGNQSIINGNQMSFTVLLFDSYRALSLSSQISLADIFFKEISHVTFAAMTLAPNCYCTKCLGVVSTMAGNPSHTEMFGSGMFLDYC